jgi:hypothetical protein
MNNFYQSKIIILKIWFVAELIPEKILIENQFRDIFEGFIEKKIFIKILIFTRKILIQIK